MQISRKKFLQFCRHEAFVTLTFYEINLNLPHSWGVGCTIGT